MSDLETQTGAAVSNICQAINAVEAQDNPVYGVVDQLKKALTDYIKVRLVLTSSEHRPRVCQMAREGFDEAGWELTWVDSEGNLVDEDPDEVR